MRIVDKEQATGSRWGCSYLQTSRLIAGRRLRRITADEHKTLHQTGTLKQPLAAPPTVETRRPRNRYDCRVPATRHPSARLWCFLLIRCAAVSSHLHHFCLFSRDIQYLKSSRNGYFVRYLRLVCPPKHPVYHHSYCTTVV